MYIFLDTANVLSEGKAFLNNIDYYIQKGTTNLTRENTLTFSLIEKVEFEQVIEDKKKVEEFLEVAWLKDKNTKVVFYGVNELSLALIDQIKKQNKDLEIIVVSDIYEGTFNCINTYINHFIELLRLAKENTISKVYFMKKEIAQMYKQLGYNVGYLMQNYYIFDNIKEKLEEQKEKAHAEKTNDLFKNILGIFYMDNGWKNNIYNTFSIAPFIPNSKVHYRKMDPKEAEFLDIHNIQSKAYEFEEDDLKELENCISLVDIVFDLEFTSNYNLPTLIAMELAIPFLVGNNNDIFVDLPMENNMYLTGAEDNPYDNQKIVLNILNNVNDQKKKELVDFKREYNKLCLENFKELLGEK